MKKRFKVSTVLKAIDKNGLPWTRRVAYSRGSACLVGQAAINLGFNPTHPRFENIVADLNSRLKSKYRDDDSYRPSLISFNDNDAQSYEEARNYAHEVLDAHKDEWISFNV